MTSCMLRSWLSMIQSSHSQQQDTPSQQCSLDNSKKLQPQRFPLLNYQTRVNIFPSNTGQPHAGCHRSALMQHGFQQHNCTLPAHKQAGLTCHRLFPFLNNGFSVTKAPLSENRAIKQPADQALVSSSTVR